MKKTITTIQPKLMKTNTYGKRIFLFLLSSLFYILLINTTIATPLSTTFYDEEISISPSSPTTNSAIVLTLSGNYPNGCYSTGDIRWDRNNRTISLFAEEQIVGDFCTLALVPYTINFNIGQLPAGTYTVNAYNYENNFLDDFSFTVRNSGGVFGTNLTHTTSNFSVPTLNGSILTAGLEIKNDGTTTTAATTVCMYLSNNTSNEYNYSLTEVAIPALSAGATYRIDHQADLCTENIPSGTYYVGFFIDCGNSINESDESWNNNTGIFLSNPISFTACSNTFNLTHTTTNFTVPNLNETTVSASLEIINDGNTTTPATTVCMYLSTTVSNTNDYELTEVSLPSLAVGSRYRLSDAIDLCSKGIPEGNYYLGFYIDCKDLITESDESWNNNTGFFGNNPFYFDGCPVNCDLSVTVGTSCSDGNNGLAYIEEITTGGDAIFATPTYTYLWSNGATSSEVSNLVPGSYNVTVTDIATGCMGIQSFTIETCPISCSLSISVGTRCSDGNNGLAYIDNIQVINGGVSITAEPTHSYLWSTGATSSEVSNLPPGTHSVTVTDINTGCTGSQAFTIEACPISCSLSISVGTRCSDGNNGLAYIDNIQVINGGVSITAEPTHSYLWSTSATSNEVSNLPPGTHSITVTDINTGCTGSQSFTIEACPSACDLDFSLSETPASCSTDKGSITINPSGDNVPVKIYLNGYLYLSDTYLPYSIHNLNPGNYTIKLEDQNNCSTEKNVAISPCSTTCNLSFSVGTSDCSAGSNGLAYIQSIQTNDGEVGTAAVPTHTYLWSTGASGNEVSNLPPGTHSVTVTDIATNCTFSQSFTMAACQNPCNLSFALSQTPAICGSDKGSITINPTGNNIPVDIHLNGYIYLSGTYLPYTISNINIGKYTIQLVDQNGCTKEESITIESDAIEAFDFTVGTRCSNGSDGIAFISFSMTSGENSTLANPTHDYNWSNGSTDQEITNLIPGTHSVTVTDIDSGCSTVKSFSIEQCNNSKDSENTGWNKSNRRIDKQQIDKESFVIPNAFTPNNDGVNDLFFIPALQENPDAYSDMELQVFNRWGRIVFQTTTYQNNWDGRSNGNPLPAGTYYYMIRFQKDRAIIKKGAVTILR